MTQKADNILGISVSLIALGVFVWFILYTHQLNHLQAMRIWSTGYRMGMTATPESWYQDSLYIEALLKNAKL